MRDALERVKRRDTFWTDIGEFDTTRSDKLERLVDILSFLHSHTRNLVVSPKRYIACEDTISLEALIHSQSRHTHDFLRD